MKIFRITCIAGLLLITAAAGAQNRQAARFAKTITVEDLKAQLSVLAHDSLLGRGTGDKGQKMAARLIEAHFRSLGLEGPVDGSYQQAFPLQKGTWQTIYLRKGDDKKENLKDFIYYATDETRGEEFANLIYLGKDPDYSAYELKGKYLVMKSDSWGAWQGIIGETSAFEPAGYIILTADQSELEFAMTRFQHLYTRPTIKPEISTSGNRIIITDDRTASWAFGKDAQEIQPGEETSIILNADMLIENISGENVMGLLRGTEKPDEVIVITSHYDHLGATEDVVYNGADDDGSGTATIMELAEAFVEASGKGKGPKRSILFMCVSGEEKGLLGSKYYTDEDPIIPLENTVTNLNLDMVGRVDDKHKGNPNYIYVIGSDKLSQDLHQLQESVNENTVNLELDYTYNDENDPNRFYYRSDHYNFAKNNIPIIFYFKGTHEDYHKPTDTIDKINFEKMKKIADLVFYTAWEIANREERIKLD